MSNWVKIPRATFRIREKFVSARESVRAQWEVDYVPLEGGRSRLPPEVDMSRRAQSDCKGCKVT